MKREFKIGDRVRVYRSPEPVFDAEIVSVHEDGRFNVKGEHVFTSAYPQQCRRLKPSKPKPEKKEARRVWLGTDVESGKVGVSTFSYRMQNPGDKEFREVLENEVVVTRETLAKAFKSIGTFRPTPKLIAAALGLEVKP